MELIVGEHRSKENLSSNFPEVMRAFFRTANIIPFIILSVNFKWKPVGVSLFPENYRAEI